MWTDLPGEFLAGVDPAYPHDDDLSAVMHGLAATQQGASYLAWSQFQMCTVLYDRLVLARENTGQYVMDGYADCVARVARQAAISRPRAEAMIESAIALRDRLPEVGDTLRDGIVADWQIRLIISRTELIGTDSGVLPYLDAEIASLLRNRKGKWDKARLRDMVDRLVFRHDPHAVRDRRRDGLDRRGVWTHNCDDGTAELTGVMTAENVRIAAKAIDVLADSVCRDDGRTKPHRRSDAMFALLTGARFECQCPGGECTATIPDLDPDVASVSTQVVIHVVTDASTLAGGTGIGFVDEHGIISDEHVRDLAARDDVTVKSVTPRRTSPIGVVAETSAVVVKSAEDDGELTGEERAADDDVTVVYPGAQSADPYRPTTACAEFVRVRDGYCTEPGCTRSAFTADLDHVEEYDRTGPAAGGATSSENLNAKCRAGHLLKTFGDWIDLQYRDPDGRLVTEYITPEGVVLPGDAETLEDHFPNLRRIRFEQAAQAPPTPRTLAREENPRRTRTRLAAKLARRRAERARNKRLRDPADNPPPF
ncbi:DUF222 domain-containing protein [Gordonia sp. zg691]|uniref:DUF222 domain-containing protein n=1 Tax=Gordonia jinghuaiqii TaxID=2758710 RepID=A0A7D7REB5_9ACTN|nr:HNH endonuclease signature motif containing protein [Gordonia jinghuaiqii]MBD0863502.1 DUF222 domain-containing protein [Gordonia jinghuaiqii]MCR5979237.1 DUF222 domain-containing protein [Gordonia jinghuaiqii]QMT04030.1 DUF222 domain-containing protein [Gordonia jinghuaiqii]